MSTNKTILSASAKALSYFSINDGLTDPFEDLDGSDGSLCKVYEPTANELIWYPSTKEGNISLLEYIDQEFYVIASCGCVSDNRPYCRIMKNKNTDILNVVFQPLILAGLGEEYNIGAVNIIRDWFLSNDDSAVANDTGCDRTVGKMVWTVKSFFDSRPVDVNGVERKDTEKIPLLKAGNYNMLTRWRYRTCIHVKSPKLSSVGLSAGLGEDTMLEFIAKLATVTKSKGVIFSGFSLGAGLATTASILFASKYQTMNVGLVSCCGDSCTNIYGDSVIKQFKLGSLNTLVIGDAVSGISGVWVQSSPVLGIDYHGRPVGKRNPRVQLLSSYTVQTPPSQLYDILMVRFFGEKAQAIIKALSVSAVFGSTTAGVPYLTIPVAGGAFILTYLNVKPPDKNFNRYHLSAERMIPLILFETIVNRMSEKDLENPTVYFENLGIELQIPLNRAIWCDWYSYSYANMFGICPPKYCRRVEVSAGRFNCTPRPQSSVQLPIGGMITGKKRQTESVEQPVGEAVKIGKLQRMLGVDPEIIRNAEQSYITAMNDFANKNAVAKEIVAHYNKNPTQLTGGKEVRFLGSLIVARENDQNLAKLRRDVPSLMTMQEAIGVLAQFRNYDGTMVFILAGAIWRDPSFFDKMMSYVPVVGSKTEAYAVSHHASFIWTPSQGTGTLVGFNPGTACWGEDLPRIITETVTEGTGLLPQWDTMPNIKSLVYNVAQKTGILGATPEGPQDILDISAVRGDAMCQTWSVLWILNFLSGCPAKEWQQNYSILYSTIRRFVLWILARFPTILSVANAEFQSVTGGKYSNVNIYDLLGKSWNAIDKNVTPPGKGQGFIFCNLK